MAVKASLSVKLIVLCAGLVLVPVLLFGAFSFQQFKSFGDNTTTLSYSALEKQALEILRTGVESDRSRIETLVDRVENDAIQLAASSNLVGYLSAAAGENEMLNTFALREMERTVEGVLQNCKSQQGLLEKKLQSDLAVAEHIMAARGKLTVSSIYEGWTSVNQFTNEKQNVALPLLRFGDSVIEPNGSLQKPTPIVDEVSRLVGGVCTIFQKTNLKGDMQRVATNVKKADGSRAIETFIPATNPDGSPNPVISAVLKGETFKGRAREYDGWYIAIYKPLYDEENKLTGMVCVGVKEQETDDLINAIVKIKLGKSGYPFVIDSTGTVIVHPRKDLIGKNAIADLNLTVFQQAIDGKKADEVREFTYTFENSRKMVAYTYFPDWDWIICASSPLQDLFEGSLQISKALLKDEISSIHTASMIKTGDKAVPAYNQIRFLNEAGQEIINLRGGEFTEDLKLKGNEAWFMECKKTPKDGIYNSGAVIAANTNKPEMRVGSPVYVKGALKGVVVLSLDWQLAERVLQSRVYGKSGYSFVINGEGVAISHPKHNLHDRVSLCDTSFGKLADIVKNQMIAGKDGFGDYVLGGTNHLVAYVPLRVGSMTYSVGATGPAGEFLTLADSIKHSVQDRSGGVIKVIAVSVVVLALLGCVIGLFMSRQIARPLSAAIMGLSEGSGNLAAASSEIASASQQLAEGASEQAASLEESSSAMEEMSSIARNNAESVQKLRDLGLKSSASMKASHKSLVKTTETMQHISASGEQMAKINRSIDEIAFQTNLLALNAAVEAARAGEAGAGFAVVADEVRNLAMRASEAAKSTQDLITETLQHIRTGSELIDQTQTEFRIMGEDGRKVMELVEEINEAIQEQSKGIDQVSLGIREMDRVVQQNAANAEESASASEELNALVEQSRSVIQDVKVLIEGKAANEEQAEPTRKSATADRRGLPAPSARDVQKKQQPAARLSKGRQDNKKLTAPVGVGDFEEF